MTVLIKRRKVYKNINLKLKVKIIRREEKGLEMWPREKKKKIPSPKDAFCYKVKPEHKLDN